MKRKQKGYPYLRLPAIEKSVPEMKSLGVSTVARSPRGFLPAYRRANGRASNLSQTGNGKETASSQGIWLSTRTIKGTGADWH